MLDILRKKKEHWISALIVLAVAIVMGFFGVSKFSSDKANPNEPVAWVNGDVISQREFYSELEFTMNQYRMILGDKFDEKLFAFQLPQQTLERMVQFKLLCQQAEKMGFFISNVELADSIRSNQYFQKDGKFDATAYSKIPNRGLMERRQRDQMAANRLQTYMTGRIKSMPADSDVTKLFKNTQVELQVGAIDFEKIAPKKAPTPEMVKAVLQNESLLKSQYEARKSEFTEKGKYSFRQIRVGIPFEASPDSRQKAMQKAQGIKKSVTGDNFESIAKAQSDDEYSKRGGDRGWVQEGTLDKSFVDALIKLQPNGVSEVLEAPGGYYILQLKDRVAAKVRPLEAVKSELAQQIAVDQSKNQFIESTRKSWEDLLSQNKPLDSELRKHGIALKSTGKFNLEQNTIPSVGNVESMIEAVYDLTPSQPIAKRLYFYQDKYYYLKLVSVSRTSDNKATKSDSDPGKTEAVAFQRDIFQNWLSTLEKQASIKLTGPFETKNKGRSASL